MGDTRKKTRTHKNKGLTLFLSVCVFLFVLTSSIAFPILCKEFYYQQIDDLELVKTTGYSEQQIRTAYKEVVDFCIGAQSEFSVGELKYSLEGKEHFEDCRNLFILDLGVLFVSTVMLVTWVIIRRFVTMRSYRPKGHGPAFWGSISLLGTFVVIGGLGAVDFDTTFVIFHSLFFPGKTNWLFDPRVDQVINILPETFFMRCAIAIVGLILLQCIVLIVADLIRNKRTGRKKR